MLTISQLARYGGATVRAVRHYHQVGLLAEPERNRSGYRTYDAAAVVQLIRIRTLAEAGVPLAKVQKLLDAGDEEFRRGVEEIDKELRAEIRRLQEHRKRIARLAAGESLALPQSVVGYLLRLRGLGVDERYIELERDAWIMVAARVPDQIDYWIAKKHEELDNPDVVRLYQLLSEAVDWQVDDPQVVELVDLLERLMLQAVEAGEMDPVDFDQPFVDLMDTITVESAPIGRRIIALLEERGWKGWTRIERVPPHVRDRDTGPAAGCR